MTVSSKTVTVEFLRKGQPHNQLLSPLTEYLGICGESGAGSVTVPYEQATFNRLLSELRYGDADEDDPVPRQQALRSLGQDLGEVLGQVPGLTGLITEDHGSASLLNLQFVTSASELSMLPFELAKVPSSTGKSSDDYLALSPATRICITRRIRSVERSNVHWPKEKIPRVLFIVGLDIDDKLRARHRQILLDALAPWSGELVELGPGDGENLAGESTVNGILDELAKGYPYIHILAHGAESGATEAPSVGLLLPGHKHYEDEDEIDILTGDRFASILRSIPVDRERPSSVFVATCDSATQSDVLAPGGSFAHSLHTAGIALVIASQFPLTTDASVSLSKDFYSDIFWGMHPLETLARARAKLHGEFAYTHDWASIVVYDALPDEFLTQLDEVQYQRAREALNQAQKQISSDKCVDDTARNRARKALGRLPGAAEYQRECEGLRASHEKQLAGAAYKEKKYDEARQHLMDALRLYRGAARRFLDGSSAYQRYATLHWVQIQAITLNRLLGGPQDEGAWWTGFRSATIELESSDEPYWAHGSLAELWLLKLFEDDLGEKRRKQVRDEALAHAREIRRIVTRNHFAVFSTARQFRRYVDPWGTVKFSQNLELERSKRWDGPLGIIEVAQQLVSALEN